jgi:hypothetical protein
MLFRFKVGGVNDKISFTLIPQNIPLYIHVHMYIYTCMCNAHVYIDTWIDKMVFL